MSLRLRDLQSLQGQLPLVRASSYPCGMARPPCDEVMLGAISHSRSPSPAPQIQLLPESKHCFSSITSNFSPAGSPGQERPGDVSWLVSPSLCPLSSPPSWPLRVTQSVAHPHGTVALRAPLGIAPSLQKHHPSLQKQGFQDQQQKQLVISAYRANKTTSARSLQGTDRHRATAGTVPTPEEDGEGQSAGAGKRRQERAEGRQLNLLLQAAWQTGRHLLPTLLPAGVRGQEPWPTLHTLPTARPAALGWKPSALEEGNVLHP